MSISVHGAIMEFITGNNFQERCLLVLDERGLTWHTGVENETLTFFVKTDYIDNFFSSSLLPKDNFILLTHNSDYSINFSHEKYLEYPFLEKWYAQNVNFAHPKLIPIPIGIANSEWPHGDVSTLKSVMQSDFEKNRLMYANFNVNTNYKQRSYCLKFVPNQFVENNVPFQTYLTHTAQSYFSICPLGNGIDSHRIWESLYLKTIPVTERTYNIEYLKSKLNLPIILVDDWSELSTMSTLNTDQYFKLIESFDPSNLDINKLLQN
jgi:hypothetical protein